MTSGSNCRRPALKNGRTITLAIHSDAPSTGAAPVRTHSVHSRARFRAFPTSRRRPSGGAPGRWQVERALPRLHAVTGAARRSSEPDAPTTLRQKSRVREASAYEKVRLLPSDPVVGASLQKCNLSPVAIERDGQYIFFNDSVARRKPTFHRESRHRQNCGHPPSAALTTPTAPRASQSYHRSMEQVTKFEKISAARKSRAKCRVRPADNDRDNNWTIHSTDDFNVHSTQTNLNRTARKRDTLMIIANASHRDRHTSGLSFF